MSSFLPFKVQFWGSFSFTSLRGIKAVPKGQSSFITKRWTTSFALFSKASGVAILLVNSTSLTPNLALKLKLKFLLLLVLDKDLGISTTLNSTRGLSLLRISEGENGVKHLNQIFLRFWNEVAQVMVRLFLLHFHRRHEAWLIKINHFTKLHSFYQTFRSVNNVTRTSYIQSWYVNVMSKLWKALDRLSTVLTISNLPK